MKISGIHKSVLVGIGLLVGIVIAEMGFRLAGMLYLYTTVAPQSGVAVRNNGVTTILCLGDSFTFGIGASGEYSYPRQLERMLNDAGTARYRVINAGIPARNSSQVALHMEENIEKYDPDIVVVLTCNSNDIESLEESNYYLLEGRGRSYAARFERWLSGCRIYKMIKVCYNDIRSREKSRRPSLPANTIGPVRSERQYTDAQKAAFERFFKAGICSSGGGALSEAAAQFEKAIAIIPEDDRCHTVLADVYRRLDRNPARAMREIAVALRINPCNGDAMKMLWRLQYDSGDFTSAQETLRKYLILHPEEEISYARLLKYGFPLKNDEKALRRLQKYNILSIIDSARKKHVKLVLMNYPYMENAFIEALAVKNSVLFVDNWQRFNALFDSKSYHRSDLMVQDGHCNDKGYRIMAENVYEVLMRNGYTGLNGMIKS